MQHKTTADTAAQKEIHKAFRALMQTIIHLRGPEGCPWDRDQTVESLRRFLVEECFETVTAINEKKAAAIQEELGDVLLVALMMGHIAEDDGLFTLKSMLERITEKLIRRHPHVFKNIQSQLSPEMVKRQWNKIKENVEGKSAIAEPAVCPPLERALRIQKTAVQKGFTWQNSKQLLAKVKEELEELQHEIDLLSKKNNSLETLEAELGDLLFSVISIGRVLNVEPSLALHRTNEKFIKRFQFLEEEMKKNNLQMNPDNLELMTSIWNKAKLQ